eukprot:378310-Lingulodinium_polyedra.AAC.1
METSIRISMPRKIAIAFSPSLWLRTGPAKTPTVPSRRKSCCTRQRTLGGSAVYICASAVFCI